MPQPSSPPVIRYAIQASSPESHLFRVTIDLDSVDNTGQRFRLPAWIPGSYMIRDFARHIGRIVALDNRGHKVGIRKIDKQTWECAPLRQGRRLQLAYEVYAYDLSVRAAHLDTTHGFFNGSSVFLCPVGQENHRCEISILPPAGQGYASWRLATALNAQIPGTQGLFGTYACHHYAELIDSPVEMGLFQSGSFEVSGVPHHVAITGRVTQLDLGRLETDLKKVCDVHARLFEPRKKILPFARYTFLALAVDEGYGGLEHQRSTALICRRTDLPQRGAQHRSKEYRQFLGLASHEYFHAWNVTRIKPAELVNPDLSQETHTTLLWLFEGFTSYYDDLGLRRAGLITTDQYLTILSDTLTDVLQRQGRLRQSLAESSFDAWTKYYKQDENAPNSIVSYYQKGSLVALALDLHIRTATHGKRSLDDVMRHLWKDWQRQGANYQGVDAGSVASQIHEATGVSVASLLQAWVEDTADPDFVALFEPFGIHLETHADDRSRAFAMLGCKLSTKGSIAQVYDGSAASHAGLSAGDDIVALDGIRAQGSRLDIALGRYKGGETVELTAFRRDEMLRFSAVLDRSCPKQWQLKLSSQSDRRLRSTQWRRAWLGPESKDVLG